MGRGECGCGAEGFDRGGAAGFMRTELSEKIAGIGSWIGCLLG